MRHDEDLEHTRARAHPRPVRQERDSKAEVNAVIAIFDYFEAAANKTSDGDEVRRAADVGLTAMIEASHKAKTAMRRHRGGPRPLMAMKLEELLM